MSLSPTHDPFIPSTYECFLFLSPQIRKSPQCTRPMFEENSKRHTNIIVSNCVSSVDRRNLRYLGHIMLAFRSSGLSRIQK